MQRYVVGGSVRDVLMGLEPKDMDFVWTGVTPEFMLAKGFKQVGADFPVFLDPEGQEHALARTETKTGTGYNGFACNFAPSVTIEDDLYRRDLACNAMAVRIEDWGMFVRTQNPNLVVDPFGGMDDIENRTLRHVSKHFAEDPVRVLRTARFAARYNFSVHGSTLTLMAELVNSGELNHLTTERVWLELEKVMTEAHPLIFFEVLDICGASEVVMPDFVVDYTFVAQHDNPSLSLEERFALLVLSPLNSSKEAEKFFTRLGAPCAVSKLSKKIKHAYDLSAVVEEEPTPEHVFQVLEVMDAFRDKNVVQHWVNIFQRASRDTKRVVDLVHEAFLTSILVSFHSLGERAETLVGPQISEAIREERIKSIEACVNKYTHETS